MALDAPLFFVELEGDMEHNTWVRLDEIVAVEPWNNSASEGASRVCLRSGRTYRVKGKPEEVVRSVVAGAISNADDPLMFTGVGEAMAHKQMQPVDHTVSKPYDLGRKVKDNPQA
jgi:hypothetical protein